MGNIITIDPVTRISGFLEIKAEVENQSIVNAIASGLLYRGFEVMLKGRAPLDAIYFTERICGICSTAHATASSLALEDALKLSITLNDRYLRDIMHGFEFVQNHLRHFYLFTVPSYVRITSIKLVEEQGYRDFRLPEELNNKIEEHYIKSIEFSRLAHEGLALLGGKAPHNHGIFAGGVTVNINAYNLEKLKVIISRIKEFVSTDMREDLDIISSYYPDYYENGISYPNYLSYGVFDKYEDKDITYVHAGVMIDGIQYPLEPANITEQVHYTWYQLDQNTMEVDLSKQDAYTFIKAPRYHGLPMEVGPLARLMIAGEYTRGHSTMDRVAARVLETEKVLNILEGFVVRVELLPNNQNQYDIPQQAMGTGMIDTTRGALGHWIQIDNQVINHYNIITPTVWNLSPRDDMGNPGVIEKALIGSNLNNIKEPIEIGRIVRSFDPCVSCATHVITNTGDNNIIEIVV